MEPTTTAPPQQHPGWTPLLAVCLGTFMLLVDVSIVNVALPDMALDLNASFAGLQWVVDIYALALAALLLLIGSASDHLGRRRTYVTGLVVFTVASLACGLAPSEGTLIAARAVQGIGAAAMFATTIALISASYSGAARGVAFGIWGATNGAAAAAGPIVGGLLTQGISWRWVFFVNVPIGIVTVVMALRALSESRRSGEARIDWLGGATFTLAAGAATFALVRAHDEGWTSAATLGVLGVALVSLLAFVVIERRAEHPLLDLSLLTRGPLAGVLAAAALFSVAAFATLIYASIWLQTVLGLSPIGAGLVTLPLSGLAFVVAATTGKVLHERSPRLVLAGGLALIGVGDLLQLGLNGASDWPRLLIGLALVGLGVGAMSPMLAGAATAAVAPERAGMAAGAMNTARQLGLAIGIAVLGSVFSARVTDHLASLPGGDRLADAVSSGGSQSALAGAPAAARAQLDAAIHDAVGSALASTFVVAGLAGLVGAAVVLITVRARQESGAAAPAAVAQPAGSRS